MQTFVVRPKYLRKEDYALTMVQIDGIHLKLTEDEIQSIDEPYQPRKVMGH